MVSVLASSAVGRGFEPRSDQTKDYTIGMCCFCVKHTALMKLQFYNYGYFHRFFKFRKSKCVR
jgi:hypothetical protein